MNAARLLFAAALVACLAGCTTGKQSLYAWGQYEEVIYAKGTKPGALSPEAEVDLLEKDRLAAEAAHRALPPGWRIHVATLYSQTGRLDLAERDLMAEKQAFPESAVLVDRLLDNLRRGKP